MEKITERQRQLSAVFLVIFVVVIVVLGMRGIVQTIRAPFNLPLLQKEVSSDEFLNRELAKKDTDSDGLSDYDELNLYGTSPYLADSDSDGENDKEEIGKGADPNCPGSENCSGALTLPQEGGTQPYAPSPSTRKTPDFSALKGILPENPTAEDVRGLLRKAGVSEADINRLSDQELIDLYQQTLNATSL